MSDVDDQSADAEEVQPEEDSGNGPETVVDILSGEEVSATPKNHLVQKTLRQLVESYGFDRKDLRAPYRLTTAGKRQNRVDVAILRHGTDPLDENVERIVVCDPQKRRERLRTREEAAPDLRKLQEKMALFPSCHLGMWTNAQEEFFLRTTDVRFETRPAPIGAWPAPGEGTEDVLREGGATQVGADPEDLEAALGRCHQYLNKNLGLDHKDAFKQLAVLLFAKLFDESRPPAERRFWIRGDEPFTVAGQEAIHGRVTACLAGARTWQPSVLEPGWDLHLNAAQVARVVTEIARYSLLDSLPRSRTLAFRAIVRSAMDGREGRYPTPVNVARMAVEMLDPKPTERLLDGSSGTGTFLGMAAAHVFEQFLAAAGVRPGTASPDQVREAQGRVAAWAHERIFGCDIDPVLAVATRMNLLMTAGHPGQVFHIDARTFPDGEFDGVAAAGDAIPDGTMDIVLTNPWFSTSKEGLVADESVLGRYDLGKIWTRTDDGQFRTTGTINTAGVPPEILFLERSWRWARPGTGRIAMLLPDGLLGNPGDEYVRWWILRHCEVLASVDLPVEPFKVTVKEYKLTPALPSLLVLRRRSDDELKQTTQPDYWVFMAAVNRAGVDARGNKLFQRAPDGEELIFDEEIIERVRVGGRIETRTTTQRARRVHDELPIVAERYRVFVADGRQVR